MESLKAGVLDLLSDPYGRRGITLLCGVAATAFVLHNVGFFSKILSQQVPQADEKARAEEKARVADEARRATEEQERFAAEEKTRAEETARAAIVKDDRTEIHVADAQSQVALKLDVDDDKATATNGDDAAKSSRSARTVPSLAEISASGKKLKNAKNRLQKQPTPPKKSELQSALEKFASRSRNEEFVEVRRRASLRRASVGIEAEVQDFDSMINAAFVQLQNGDSRAVADQLERTIAVYPDPETVCPTLLPHFHCAMLLSSEALSLVPA